MASYLPAKVGGRSAIQIRLEATRTANGFQLRKFVQNADSEFKKRETNALQKYLRHAWLYFDFSRSDLL